MTVRVELPAKLDLVASESLLDTLKDHRGQDLTLDASGVEHLGAHALQTLIIARSSWESDGKALTVADLTDEVIEQIETLGVTEQPLFKAEES